MSSLLSQLRLPFHSRLLLKRSQLLWARPSNARAFQEDASQPSPKANYVGKDIIQGGPNPPPTSDDQNTSDDRGRTPVSTPKLGGVARRNPKPDQFDDRVRPPPPPVLEGVSRLDPTSDPFGVKEMVTLEDLLEARVHFGHKAGMWDPRMTPYIYGIRNKIHILNLDTTLVNLRQALNVIGHIAYRHGIILFVNERPQFESLTEQLARNSQEYFVTNWIPGTLSNSYQLLKTLIAPDLIVFTSITRSLVAVREAVSFGIPSVGVVDSNCNPDSILYPIPGNDDSPQAILLYYELFSTVIARAKQLRLADEAEVERRRELKIKEQWEVKEKASSTLDTEFNSLISQ